MASSTSSLHFLSLTPKSLSLSNTKATAALSSISFNPLPSKSISITPSLLIFPARPFSRFVRNVVAASDLEQDEDFLNDAVEQPRFSPDLKLFVGNLSFNTDSSALAGLFESAGNVEMVEVIYDKETGRSRGFGFVTMSTAEEAEAAAQQFNGYELDGRPLRVNNGPPPPKEESSRFRGGASSFRGGGSRDGGRGGSGGFSNSNRVYVGNLSWGVDDLALETLFKDQGKVMEAKVVYDRETGRSRGFGFVTYSSSSEVSSAIESLDGADLDGRSIRVSVAEERPPRRQY